MAESRAEVRNPPLLAAVATLAALLGGLALHSMNRLEGELRTARPLGKDLPAALQARLPGVADIAAQPSGGGEAFWFITKGGCAECRAAEAEAIEAAARHGLRAHVVMLDEVRLQSQAAEADLSKAPAGLPWAAPMILWREAEGWRMGDARDPRTLKRALRLEQDA